MREYILTLLCAAIAVSVSSLILPDGNIRKYAKLVCSVMVSLTVAVPFRMIKIDLENFDFPDTEDFAISREEAEKIYAENIKEGVKKQTEEELSVYGRVYVTVNDELGINLIEIYTEREIGEEEKGEIKEKYNPLRLEIYYG